MSSTLGSGLHMCGHAQMSEHVVTCTHAHMHLALLEHRTLGTARAPYYKRYIEISVYGYSLGIIFLNMHSECGIHSTAPIFFSQSKLH